MKENKLYKKSFILLLYATSLLIFSLFYQSSNNFVSYIFETINEFVDDPQISNGIDNFSMAIQSFQVQFPLRIITGLVGVYINSSLLFITYKIWTFFSKSKKSISFYDTTQAFYLSLYASILNNVLISLFMLKTGTAIDYHQNIFFVFYSLWIFTVSSLIIIFYLNKKHKFLKPAILFLSISFVIQSFFKLGGYYDWDIF